MVPGNPVANMYFAMYGQNPQVSRKSYAGEQRIVNIDCPQVQAIALLEDLKLGIYVKIPPRITFLYQMVRFQLCVFAGPPLTSPESL